MGEIYKKCDCFQIILIKKPKKKIQKVKKFQIYQDFVA